MKNHSKVLLAVLLSISSLAGIAQKVDTRPNLYASRPQSINIDKNIFTPILDAAVGQEVSFVISPDFTFKGTVLSNFSKYNQLHTVMVRSNENASSILQITHIQSDDNVSYTGRIINSKAADGYEIKNNNGAYSLQKFETLKLLDPCTL